ncbi:MAG: magnesium chelatase subunit D family protein [Candidatus Obscuribacter sp.]|nr:magnesium chelatase subunit D family protein [Candidatus Obscuribacter sp.]
MKQYPLSAIVGQDDLLLALTICAVNPLVGGVLIRGDKGSAKSTAARALVQVMPPIMRRRGCRFNCLPEKPLEICAVCSEPQSEPELTAVPFINLPLGVTEERLLGTLDLDKILKENKKEFQPGLLAACHRGVLYIDEVNLLPDHIVDLLLDTAAMGTNIVEREGFSISHPAKISLIGTMNPEEGDLRPQLLDRFGLMVEVKAPREPQLRAEIVRRRSQFEADPERFNETYKSAQEFHKDQIKTAGKLLDNVELSEPMLLFASTICSELGLASLRGDLVLGQTARTIAALEGRLQVSLDDLRQAARLALPHRQRTKPGERTGMNEERLKDLFEQAEKEAQAEKNQPRNQPSAQNQPPHQSESAPIRDEPENTTSDTEEESEGEAPKTVSAVGQNPYKLALDIKEFGSASAKSNTAYNKTGALKTERGAAQEARPDLHPQCLAPLATIKHALVRKGTIKIERADLHQKDRSSRNKNLILFVVDCSGSMAARKRMEAVKGAVRDLLEGAYQDREPVAVITFADSEAKLIVPPTRSIERAQEELQAMETGGKTPLAGAFALVNDFLDKSSKEGEPLMVLISDGRANVALGKGDPFQESLNLAEKLRERRLASLVIDTETGFVKLERAREIADRLKGSYISLNELSAESITLTVRRHLHALGRRQR